MQNPRDTTTWQIKIMLEYVNWRDGGVFLIFFINNRFWFHNFPIFQHIGNLNAFRDIKRTVAEYLMQEIGRQIFKCVFMVYAIILHLRYLIMRKNIIITTTVMLQLK